MAEAEAAAAKIDEEEKTRDRQRSRRVHFPGSPGNGTDPSSSLLVTLTVEADVDYDRTAVESDIFSCDVCGIQIPAGIKGYEPYGTCLICPEGFDVCGACCGSENLMRICHTANSWSFFDDENNNNNNNNRPSIQVSCHEHALVVVDRFAEGTGLFTLSHEN